MKILIGTPIFEGMSYCFNEFLKAVKEINYSPFDILFVDNSRTRDFFNKISKEPDIKVIYDDTKKEFNNERLTSSSNKILQYARDNNYDYLLMLDADVIAPKNILNDLIKHKKDVVSGVYYSYFIWKEKAQKYPVAFQYLTEKEFEKFKADGMHPEITDRFDIAGVKRFLTQKEIDTGELLEVAIPSNGCMLLSRNFLDLGINYGLTEKITGPDVFLFMKARDKFKFYVDSKIICKHLVEGKYKKDDSGTLIHPLSSKFN